MLRAAPREILADALRASPVRRCLQRLFPPAGAILACESSSAFRYGAAGTRHAYEVAGGRNARATFAGIACRSYANLGDLPANANLAVALPELPRQWLNYLL
jgi:hypothetical protein